MATYELPHHKLIAYEVAKELLVAVRDAHVKDAGLRDQALRAAKSACLNAAEGAGRVSRADKARVFAIARAEAGEAAAAVEIAVLSGDANPADLSRVVSIANRLIAMLRACPKFRVSAESLASGVLSSQKGRADDERKEDPSRAVGRVARGLLEA